MSEYVDFHYMPLEGKITGKQVLKQTEDAINDLGQHVYEIDIDDEKIQEAIDTSNQAIETAEEALAVVTTNRAVWYNSVTELREAIIDNGIVAAIKGYAFAGDEGQAFYVVREKKSGDVDDGKTIIFLDAGNVAEIIANTGITNMFDFDEDGYLSQIVDGDISNQYGEKKRLASYEGQQEIVEAFNDVINASLDIKGNAESARNSAEIASNTMTQLLNYLETKEEITAPIVDPTLTISGAAADAQVTGESVDSAFIVKQLPTLFGLGAINSSTGSDLSSQTAMRTRFIDKSIIGFKVDSGYQYAILAYQANHTYVGCWNGSAFDTTSTWFSNVNTLVFFKPLTTNNYTYRIVVKRDDDANIDLTTEASKISFVFATDNTFSVKNASADAKSVGELKNDIYNGVKSLYTNPYDWYSGYISASGALTSSANNMTPTNAPFKINNGETIYVDSGSYVCSVGLFTYNAGTYARYYNQDHTGTFKVTADSDNCYCALVFKTNPLAEVSRFEFDGKIYVDADWKDSADANGLVYAYTDLTQWTNGYWNSSGTKASTPNKITPLSSPIQLLPGDVVVVNPGSLVATINTYAYSGGVYTRQSSSNVTTLTTLTYASVTYVTVEFGKNPAGATSPSEFNGYIKTPSAWMFKINSNTYRISALESASQSVLFGKKLVACGDSMTVATNPDGGYFDSYAKIVADRNGMVFATNAVSGSTMTNVAGHNPFCVDRYLAVPNDFDYLTIWFGWNDGAYATVGSISDTVDTTFYGAYKKVLEYFITTYPTKKIGIVVPYMQDTDFQDAVRAVSAMYGVPCLDLPNGNECSLVYGTATTAQLARRAALTYDGTHPNQAGHDYISSMYEAFLKRL